MKIEKNFSHRPVMPLEVVKYINPRDGKNYLDCTFGAGGYSKAILSAADCSLKACDRDPGAAYYAAGLKEVFRERFEFLETRFSSIADLAGGKKFDGIVLDLGISSTQLDNYERGFAFSGDGPLDMRMEGKGMSAADFVNEAGEGELAEVIYKYGEEKAARKIAKNIVSERKKAPINTTFALASLVRDSIGFRKGKIDPATKTFQAIRIYINDELGELEAFLGRVGEICAPGGRIVIVSFHSLEDSLVKDFFKKHGIKKVARSKYSKEPQIFGEGEWLKILTPKAVFPSKGEVRENPRSRSARLRAAEKVAG